VAAGVAGRPGPQDTEEVPVADRQPQLVDGHGAPDVHRPVEQQLRAGVADDHAPERVVGRDPAVEGVEQLLGRAQALLLAPHPLRVLGEALVQPDVLPLGQGHAVAEPLVGELVDHHRVAAGRAGEEELGVDRAGLGLQREQEVVVVVDDAAAGREVVLDVLMRT
jgi:hypothetical protein